jgi:hypothetical protein
MAISVEGFYAGIVELDDAGGGPLRSSSRFGPVKWDGVMNDTTATTLPRHEEAILAGIDPSELVHPSRHRRVFLYRSKHVQSRIGPLDVPIQEAGYQDKTIEIWLGRVSSSIDVFRESLVSITDFGSLEIRAKGLASGERELLPDKLLGILTLSPMATLSRFARPIEVGIRALDGDTMDVPGIPFGTYRAVFESASGTYVTPTASDGPSQLEISESPAHFDIDATGAGRILVKIGREALTSYADWMVVELQRTGTSFVKWDSVLREPPYAIELVSPGSYLLRVRTKGSIGVRAEEWMNAANVVVRAGETTSVAVQ